MSTEQNGVADALHPGYVSPPDVVERAKLRLVTEALTLLALERIEASDVIVAGTSPELHVVVGTADRIAKWFPPSPAPADRAALERLCDQLEGMKHTMFRMPGTGQNYSYWLREDASFYVEEARKFLAAPAAAVQPSEQEKKDAARFRWSIANPSWSMRWRLKKGAEQWQMVDDGEPWGQWGPARKVLDAAIAAATPEQSDTTKGQA